MDVSIARLFGEGGSAEVRAFAAAAIHTRVMEEVVESPGVFFAVARKHQGRSRPGPRAALSCVGERETFSSFTRSVARQSSMIMAELVGEACDDTVDAVLAALLKDPDERAVVRRIDEASSIDDLRSWADEASRSKACRSNEGLDFGVRMARHMLELGRRVYDPQAPVYRLLASDCGSAFRLPGGDGPVAASVASADVKGAVSGAIGGCIGGAAAGGVGCLPGAASGGAVVGFGMSVGQLAADIWDDLFD